MINIKNLLILSLVFIAATCVAQDSHDNGVEVSTGVYLIPGDSSSYPATEGFFFFSQGDGVFKFYQSGGFVELGGGSTAWGAITGTLSNQTDLQTALDDKIGLSASTYNTTGASTWTLNKNDNGTFQFTKASGTSGNFNIIDNGAGLLIIRKATNGAFVIDKNSGTTGDFTITDSGSGSFTISKLATGNLTLQKNSGTGSINIINGVATGNITIQNSGIRTDSSAVNEGRLQSYVPTVSINALSEDTSPSLGGNLDVNGNTINGVTFTGDISIPDEVYGVAWNGSVEVPTKNALYDKIETISQDFWPLSGNATTGGAQTITLGGNLVLGGITFNPTYSSFYGGALSDALANNSIAFGFSCDVSGAKSVSIGESNDITSTGDNNSIIGSRNNSVSAGTRQSMFGAGSSTISSANPDNSIFGSTGSTISSGTNVTLIGGTGISISTGVYNGYTIADSLAIWDLPQSGDSGDSLITWNPSTKKIRVLSQSAISGGGISSLVEDASPQLGGTLDFNGQTIGTLAITDTEVGYLNDVTSNIQTQLNGKFDKSADDAADVDYTPNQTWKNGNPSTVQGIGDTLQTYNPVQIVMDTVNIGDWDMDTDDSNVVSIPSGVDWTKIIDVRATIRRDDDSAHYPLIKKNTPLAGTVEGGVDSYSSGGIQLVRFRNGFFDDTNFNATSFNRGWVIIFYMK